MNFVANILRQSLSSSHEDGKASKEDQSAGSEENTTVGLLRELCATPTDINAPGRRRGGNENLQ